MSRDGGSVRALITGGAGFIGSALVDRLLEEGQQVTVYDNLSSGRHELISGHLANPAFRFIEADVLDLPRLQECAGGHEVVWHLAANGNIQSGFQDTGFDLKQSVEGTRNVLEAMRTAGIQDLLFSSSGSVYGETSITPTPETAGPLLPISLYAAAKLGSEAFISAFASLFGLRAWIFRFGNVVGPRMTRGVTFDLIRKLRENPDELEILGDGAQEKPYFMVDDCIDGMLYAFRHIPMTAAKPCDIFNLGAPSRTRVLAIAQIIMEEMSLRDVQLKFTGGRGGWPGDQPQVHLSFEKMAGYGWRAKQSSDEAIRAAAKLLIHEAAAAPKSGS